MNAPHWDAWSVENLPGLEPRLKVAEMVRWWGRSYLEKQLAHSVADMMTD